MIPFHHIVVVLFNCTMCSGRESNRTSRAIHARAFPNATRTCTTGWWWVDEVRIPSSVEGSRWIIGSQLFHRIPTVPSAPNTLGVSYLT